MLVSWKAGWLAGWLVDLLGDKGGRLRFLIAILNGVLYYFTGKPSTLAKR